MSSVFSWVDGSAPSPAEPSSAARTAVPMASPPTAPDRACGTVPTDSRSSAILLARWFGQIVTSWTMMIVLASRAPCSTRLDTAAPSSVTVSPTPPETVPVHESAFAVAAEADPATRRLMPPATTATVVAVNALRVTLVRAVGLSRTGCPSRIGELSTR